MNPQMFAATESEKIMYVVNDVLGATSPKTAVDMRTIVDKGIDLGLTHDYPRGRQDGHPWWPHTAVMMGVGSPTAVENLEEPYLHRDKMKKGNTRVRMYYWVDKSHRHEMVTKDAKATKYGESTSNKVHIPRVKVSTDPALMTKVCDYLDKKGYKYLFGLQGSTHILTLNLYGEYFLNIPVTTETADRVLGLIPYFFHRPDYIKEEIPDAYIKKNWKLKNIWNTCTSK